MTDLTLRTVYDAFLFSRAVCNTDWVCLLLRASLLERGSWVCCRLPVCLLVDYPIQAFCVGAWLGPCCSPLIMHIRRCGSPGLGLDILKLCLWAQLFTLFSKESVYHGCFSKCYCFELSVLSITIIYYQCSVLQNFIEKESLVLERLS